ncbi:tRNA epoxyqueuosine(34) reductase QueG [Lentilactobacillus farraginis]|uniref:Iron-sulfur cluster-binding protein n=3 Tax=Lentilactobacillus farraginis DSM 18382 = JCM 14108 TaxID=1423743 RepID=A0A0R1VTK5_9LACO|nr:tRNA epoxyqueuosine(34) reductase QueG [Lentilactobacillus farraginis]KRM08765.1 iron-sulfur cluster-binding protein [Lentilactobacillus farraginis DSM 18382 = JCM 14108]
MRTPSALKERIIAESRKIGIDKIGFTTADDFESLRSSLEAQKAAGHTSGFEHPNLDERLNPKLILKDAKTIIAIALAYPSKLKRQPPRTGLKRGQFARASWGDDYHDILREKMALLTERIQELTDESVSFEPMVDTGQLIDVAVANRAGLGFIGKNGLLITEEFGSFVYLGEIVTNLVLAPDQPIPCQCGDCTRCLDACPVQALLGDGRMNAQRCLSYQTQTKGVMADEFRPKIRNVIYGCDICQVACPFNRGKDFHRHARMEPETTKVRPELLPMLTLSNRQFKDQFGNMAGAWRGKKPLQRNAMIALANLGDASAVPDLLAVMSRDPRPMIRATAAYAVGRLVRKFDEPVRQAIAAQYQKARQANEAPEFLTEYHRALLKIDALIR